MNTSFVLLAFVLATGPVVAVSTTNHAVLPRTAAASPNRLDLSVIVPASISRFRVDSVADTIAGIVETRFKEDGFSGQLGVVTASDQSMDVPTLAIELIDWRVTPSRFIECIFIADLRTADGEQHLGLCTGISFAKLNRFDRSNPYDTAATDAIDNLYVELREMNLLPANIR